VKGNVTVTRPMMRYRLYSLSAEVHTQSVDDPPAATDEYTPEWMYRDQNPLIAVEAAAALYQELSEAEYFACLRHFAGTPAREVLAMRPARVEEAVRTASSAMQFRRTTTLVSPSTRECLELGVIEAHGPRHFVIAQWGYKLTELDDMYFWRGLARRLKRLLPPQQRVSLG